jgi:hypothetical protein
MVRGRAEDDPQQQPSQKPSKELPAFLIAAGFQHRDGPLLCRGAALKTINNDGALCQKHLGQVVS